MALKRRLGTESSATRAALMDAVEAVMRADGYGALTARKVAERAGLKHQLVYYYFPTLDDLLVATYQRHIERYLARTEQALQSQEPLHAFWKMHANPADAVLNTEFLAMANHNEAIRVRTIEFGEFVRCLGLPNLDSRLKRPPGGKHAVTAFSVTIALTSIGSILGLETSIGIKGGHPEIHALIEWCIDQLEPREVQVAHRSRDDPRGAKTRS
jgi:AcrR family transcriptional regulator